MSSRELADKYVCFSCLTFFFKSLNIWESLFWGMLEDKVHTILVAFDVEYEMRQSSYMLNRCRTWKSTNLSVWGAYISTWGVYIWTSTSQNNFSLEIMFFFNIAKKLKSWFSKMRNIYIAMFLQHAINSSSRKEFNSVILQFAYGLFPPSYLKLRFALENDYSAVKKKE